MRFIAPILMVLLMIPLVYSGMEMGYVEEAYNLGEQIKPVFSVDSDRTLEGLLYTELVCDSYDAVYYVTPVNIVVGVQEFEPYPLNVFGDMIGDCILKASLKDMRQVVIYEVQSGSFEVSDELQAELEYSNLSLNPGEKFGLSGVLKNLRGESISGKMVSLLKGESMQYDVDEFGFDIEIDIPNFIKSGENNLLLTFEDDNGNSVGNLLKIDIIPKATSIEIELNDDIYLPYEVLVVTSKLRDQALDPMDGEMGLSIVDNEGKGIYAAETSGMFNYSLENIAEPGNYSVIVSYGDISSEAGFEIARLVMIVAEVEEQKVVITNTGNVDYDNISEVVISSGDDEIVVKKDVKLEPGESLEIDMSKEVKEGVYSVSLPTGETVGDVAIDDNRNIFKKAFSGVGAITGFVVGGIEHSPLKSMIILVVFLMAIVGLALLQYFQVPVIPKIKAGVKGAFRNFSESAKLPSVHVVKKKPVKRIKKP